MKVGEGLELVHRKMPLGVVLVVFESRPDCLPQVRGHPERLVVGHCHCTCVARNPQIHVCNVHQWPLLHFTVCFVLCLATQVAGLAIATGNGLLIKGGSEALHSNQCLYGLVKEALKEYGIDGAIALVRTILQSQDFHVILYSRLMVERQLVTF